VVVVVGRRRERVDARMLSFVSHPFSLHSFIHSFMVFLLLIIVKRREEKRREERRENCISERRSGYFYCFLNSTSLVARFLLIYWSGT